MKNPENKRNRFLYILLIVAVIGVGLASRRISLFPDFLGQLPGDGLWALMVFLCWGFVFPKLASMHIGALGFATSYLVEFSQLYQAPWINAIRDTTLGHLVLGNGFYWPDLIAYTVGIAGGLGFERLVHWMPIRSSGLFRDNKN